MKFKQFDVWLADLNPRFGTEAGKIRPVLIVQNDLLNKWHPSTIVCPITSRVIEEVTLLRVKLIQNEGGLEKESAILIDQLRAIDKKRFLQRLGQLSPESVHKVQNSLKVVLDLE